ncbi:MAG: DUF2656 family protein [Cyanobacteria bacterium P01_A01_bin.15]
MTALTRMLLSHNCTLLDGQVAPLNRADFAHVFISALKPHQHIRCSLIDNPHWIVEVLFNTQQHSPTDMAKLCAQGLSSRRSEDPYPGLNNHTIMLLGGIKTTPALGSSPTSLRPGEWGVDVVETVSPQDFLAGINWETAIASKPSEQIFKVTQMV